ncbi:acyltransferase family protein [Pseudonocardia abyssalis]|uniref:Acyltransferase n=1 Tax=Pseudonocardia abyssalis TaxID=2792008 RepID=A0ABS6UXB8_9PSEU|nr:acyltransferase family protein [Pseudonocardia abyssalis]MBW0117079.1 acyltransferase [Pseudonocardia abyssalis]MBW0136349.1 acyltransferase [Pseudonocardia abyssalis]
MTSTGPAPAAPGPSVATQRRFRPELQGLRAVAVVLVVVYHVWFNRVSGGVDVFFVITGFLLTGQLLRSTTRTAVPVLRQWARTLGRLLPAALIVLLGTVLGSALVLPESRWLQAVREVLASSLFLQNWQLAADSVDYAAQNNSASVVQHFWSLSIQVQVMLAAPVLMLAVVAAARSTGASPRRHLTYLLAGVFVLSLGFSILLTSVDQPFAYFHTVTRLWEFAFGGLLALAIDRVRLSAWLRVRLGWTGLVGLVACGLVLQVDAVFPGYAALWPTTCAALVLLAGDTGSRSGADRILSSAPLRRLGDLSYALYLWHWPLLVLVLVSTRQEQLGLGAGLTVIAVALALSVVTEWIVQRPKDPFRVAVAGLAVVLAVTASWQLVAVARTSSDGVVGSDLHPGAVGGDVPVADLLPAPAGVTEDWVRLENWDCAPLSRFPWDSCRLPVAEEPQRRIVLVGDSHVQQFAGALVPIAERSGWQLISMVFGACPFSTVSEVVPDEQACLDWNEAAAAEIADLQPDAVVTLASRDVRVGLTEQTPDGFVQRWQQLADLGIPVLAVRDNPRFDYSPADCIQQVGRGAVECGVAREEVYAPDPPYAARTDVPSNVAFLDIADAVCDDVLCPAERGNVLVYMDDNHLTATYAASMATLLEGRIRGSLGW